MALLVIWLLFGVGCAIAASNKKRNVPGWFFLGMLLGPFGLLFILLLAPLGAASSVSIAPIAPSLAPILSVSGGISLDQETKSCPHCAETIKLAAKKCRFCLEIFDPEQVNRDIEQRRQELAEKYALLSKGKKQCPSCLQWDVHTAVIEGGGMGDWCPHCQKSLQKMANPKY